MSYEKSHENFHYAALDDSAVKALQSLEKDFDNVLVAYDEDKPLAKLSEEQINKLKQLEDQLSRTIVAYDAQ